VRVKGFYVKRKKVRNLQIMKISSKILMGGINLQVIKFGSKVTVFALANAVS